MRCHGCNSLMVLDKQETGTSSCTQWHSCPLCGKVRLTSQPESNLSDTNLGTDLGAEQLTEQLTEQLIEQLDAYSQDSVDTHQRSDQRSEVVSTHFNYT